MYDVFIYSINTIVHISVNSVVYKVKTCFTAVCILHIYVFIYSNKTIIYTALNSAMMKLTRDNSP